MNASKFLAKAMGVYLVLLSLTMLTNMAQFSSLIQHLINDAPLMFAIGFFIFIVGVLSHLSTLNFFKEKLCILSKWLSIQ